MHVITLILMNSFKAWWKRYKAKWYKQYC